ncbi:MAG: oxidoreductase [Paenibacillus sp.]|nr:oxidoreductase [Paenibacillus sp.]
MTVRKTVNTAAVRPLVERDNIRLAMLGMVDGNGHPYSWSAIFNGYDPEEMKSCPYPVIPTYLGKQPKHTLRIEGANITHIWTDDPEDALRVSRATLIPHVAERPEDVIGEVDAVIIATDKGHEHVERCRPFVEAGIPVFVDKPLVDNEADLTITTPKSWERYGIHALESIYPIFGPGFASVRNTGSEERNVVHIKHSCGADIVAAAQSDMYGAFGLLQLCGTAGHAFAQIHDTFYSFKTQLQSFVDYLRSGQRPFPFEETIELMKLIIAGIRSREEGGREVQLTEIAPVLPAEFYR